MHCYGNYSSNFVLRASPCHVLANSPRTSQRRRHRLRRQLPHLHGAGWKAALVGLPSKAVVPVAARCRSRRALARLVARSANGRNVHYRLARQSALGPGSNSLSHASAAPSLVGDAAVVFPWQHVVVAAPVSLDRAEPLPPQRHRKLWR